MNGKKRDQAEFLNENTLQFYYELEIKLKQSLEELRENWTLNVSMNENTTNIVQQVENLMKEL